MITFENITKVLNGKPVLDGISFNVRKGEVFVIVGPSGVGKSVTLKHMVRLFTPDSGHVLVNGTDITNLTGESLRKVRGQFGYLFQGGALLAWLTVAQNVALPLLENTDMEFDEVYQKVVEMLKLVGLEDDANKYPSEISGGMRKRAGLARAIITDPGIILYDEPTSGLDPVTARTIDHLIERMKNKIGVTSVVVTHDLHSALSIGTTIAMLYDGKIVEMSSPEKFIKSSNDEVQNFLESQFITKKGSWEGHI